MKKIVCLILALALILISLPSFVLAQTTVNSVHNLSSVSGLSEKLNSEDNIVLGFERTTTIGSTGAYSATTGSLSSPANITVNPSTDPDATPTNGKIDEAHLDFVHRFKPTEDTYTTVPVDVTFSFYGNAKMDAFLLAGTSQASQTTMFTQEFAIFAGNSIATLYDESNKVYHYTRGETNYNDHYITFSESVEASYIGLRVYKGVTDDMAQYKYSYFRAREIAIFGEVTIPEGYDALDPQKIAAATAKLKDKSNLLQDNYVLSYKNEPGTITFSGHDGSKYYKNGNVVNFESEHPYLDMNNGIIGNCTDIRVGANDVQFLDSNKNYRNVYIDVTINFRHKAEFNEIFISGSSTPSLRTQEYYLYASDDLSALYNNSNKIATFVNPNSAKDQCFTFETPIKAKYLGMRITKAVNAELYAFGIPSSYARIAEFAVFGKYDVDYYSYSVSSIGNIVSASGEAYEGAEKTFTAPLVSGMYTLSGWKLNGEDYDDFEIDEYANISEATFIIDGEMEIEAVYTNEVSDFGETELKTSSDGYVLVDNMIVDALKNSFDNYRSTLKVTYNETERSNEEYVRSGDMIGYYKNGNLFSRLIAAEKFNCDMQNGVNVTDILSAVDKVLMNEHSELDIFVMDDDENGDITVSDIVAARKYILETERTDYSNQTVAIKDLDYKPLGRTEVADDQLILEMTASGFSFNADCYGDVSMNLAQEKEKIYYAIFVDGERQEDIIVPKGAAKDYVIAKNLPAGEHTFEIIKQEEAGYIAKVNSINLNGEIRERPEDKDLYIEFVGDSITCGAGNLQNGATNAKGKHEDGTYAYSTQTAFMLDADYGIISRSGSSLIDDRAKNATRAHMPTEYEKVSLSSETPWSFERKADVVVVNLGTNDNGIIANYISENTSAARTEYFSGLAYDFAKRIIELNGNDVNVVFALGLMSTGTSHDWAKEAYRQAAQKLTNEGYNAYFCELPVGTDGAANHPNVENGIEAAELLSSFIKDNVLK